MRIKWGNWQKIAILIDKTYNKHNALVKEAIATIGKIGTIGAGALIIAAYLFGKNGDRKN